MKIAKLRGDKLELAQLLLDGGMVATKIAKKCEVSHTTVYRNIKEGKLEVYEEFEEYIPEDEFYVGEWYRLEEMLGEIIDKVYEEGEATIEQKTQEGRRLGFYVLNEYGGIDGFLEKFNSKAISPHIKKACVECGEGKGINDFYTEFDRCYGKSFRCKDCDNKRIAPYVKAWVMDNKEKHAVYVKKWQIRNPDRMKEANLRRRARVESLPNDFDIRVMRKNFGNACALTGVEDVHMDHFIPISWGHGGTTNGNIYPLSSELNLSKHNRNPFEWFESVKDERGLDESKFNELVAKLAELNKMSVEEFTEYVYWCDSDRVNINEKETIL